MTDMNRTPMQQWTVKQTIMLAVLCLVAGIASGWAIRASQSKAATSPTRAANAAPQAGMGTGAASAPPSPAQLKSMADAQAAPLLERLKANPQDADVLVSLGNLYYNAQQYPAAVDYYGRVLEARPSDAAVRTDMGTAYWYMGNADRALAEFDKALSYAPNNANTLFNRGLVRWKGKKDAVGALADWEKLLKANPSYQGKDQVEKMMAEARQQASAKPESKAK